MFSRAPHPLLAQALHGVRSLDFFRRTIARISQSAIGQFSIRVMPKNAAQSVSDQNTNELLKAICLQDLFQKECYSYSQRWRRLARFGVRIAQLLRSAPDRQKREQIK